MHFNPKAQRHALPGLFVLIALILIVALRFGGCESCQTERRRATKAIRHNAVLVHSRKVDAILSAPRRPLQLTDHEGRPKKNRIVGVKNYSEAFPDLNDVQLRTARVLGISLIANREEAHHHLRDLVYIGDNPYFRVERLSHSIPYLVPRAERLLTEIARNFIDSLQSKGLPFYKIVVTSVLRTRQDVDRLRRVNGNASENSCHQYGTTFDICYNSFYRVYDPDDQTKRQVWSGNLKAVLAEVLADQRRLGTCYVRYEAFQSCFHITAR